jgi:uncharacterized protein YndB with AHSA1/START domain
MKPSAVNTPSDTQVEVVRSFDAPVDLVWKSFTVPELVSRWMVGPPGWSMPICEMDFRVGGKYENRFRNDEQGAEFGLVGEFREIETLSKIVQDERYRLGNAEDDLGKEAVVTLTFQETNGVTTVATLIEYASEEDRDAALATGMTAAMEMGYCRIDGFLAG